VSTTHHAGWYLPGLWMLYWKTGDDKYLKWIKQHSNALWENSTGPKTGMPWVKFNLETQKPEGHDVSHRMQYQAAALNNWPAYMRSLRSGRKYQVVSDSVGNTMVLVEVDSRKLDRPVGAHSPDYFGCMDLRIPYALGVITEDPTHFEVISDDFKTHEVPARNATGLWTGPMRVPPSGPFRSHHTWTACAADNTYVGLLLYDLTGRKDLLETVKKQTRLAIKYGYNERRHYFYHRVNTLTGIVMDPRPRWHANWEWTLTLLLLHEMTGDPSWKKIAEENYKFLIDNIRNPGNYFKWEASDWNVPQLALLCLFRYHQTGDEKYLEDARKVADYLVLYRIRKDKENLYVGEDRYMGLRDVGDFIAMLVCLSDPSLPVMSSRYFLYPVGIRSPVFPVFKDAYVSRFYTRKDGVVMARVQGGEGAEDIYVMDLSGDIKKVLLNGKPVTWKEKKVAGHRFVVLPEVKLKDAKIEIHPG
jgi:rhamnogalacturonyl hydrolase YesR